MTSTQKSPRSILRLPAVKARVGLGPTSIYEMMKAGTFPRSRPIAGTKAHGWDSLEIDAWIDRQLGERRDMAAIRSAIESHAQ